MKAGPSPRPARGHRRSGRSDRRSGHQDHSRNPDGGRPHPGRRDARDVCSQLRSRLARPEGEDRRRALLPAGCPLGRDSGRPSRRLRLPFGHQIAPSGGTILDTLAGRAHGTTSGPALPVSSSSPASAAADSQNRSNRSSTIGRSRRPEARVLPVVVSRASFFPKPRRRASSHAERKRPSGSAGSKDPADSCARAPFAPLARLADEDEVRHGPLARRRSRR